MDPDHLIDIAVFNEVRDWGKVAADGIKGASIKVSQQVNYLNPLAKGQFEGARSVDIAAGGYHFGDPRVSAARQASYFVANARGLGAFRQGALAPMYDAENWEGGGLVWPNPKTLNDHIREHIRVVREETGVLEHLVYGSLSWWLNGWIDPDIWSDEHVLNWIAVYNGQPGNLSMPGGTWDHPRDALHQHTSSGIVPGVVGHVDKNTTLRGRKIADLTIGNTEDDMSGEGPNIIAFLAHGGDSTRVNSMEAAEAAGIDRTSLFGRVLDTQLALTNKLPALATGDDVNEVESLVRAMATRLEQFIESNRLQATVLANLAVAEQGRDVDERARDDADRVRDEAILAILHGLATGDIDVSELAEKLAEKLPPSISVQDVVDAFVSVAGTVSFQQKPTSEA
jgi:GH25 family lysozyme M1 (1,4-beta-N-acetylmuramidase)